MSESMQGRHILRKAVKKHLGFVKSIKNDLCLILLKQELREKHREEVNLLE